MNKIQEKMNQIEALRKKLSEVFVSAGESPTEDHLNEVKSLKTEIDGLETEVEGLKAFEAVKATNVSAMSEISAFNKPVVKGQAEPMQAKLFNSDNDFSNFVAKRSEIKVGLKSLITGASTSSAGAMIQTQYAGGERYPELPSVLGGMTVGPLTSNVISFWQCSSRTNSATGFAEPTSTSGLTKAEGSFDMAEVLVNSVTISVWVPVTEKSLRNAAQLEQLINTELRYQVLERLQYEVFQGIGGTANLTGLVSQSNIQTQTYTASSMLTSLRKGKTKALNGGAVELNAVYVNPADWESIELTKNSQNDFYYNGPAFSGPDSIWGVPVVETNFCPQGTAFIGDFRTVHVDMDGDVRLSMTESHSDFFTRNINVIRAEIDVAMYVLSPTKICKVALA